MVKRQDQKKYTVGCAEEFGRRRAYMMWNLKEIFNLENNIRRMRRM